MSTTSSHGVFLPVKTHQDLHEFNVRVRDSATGQQRLTKGYVFGEGVVVYTKKNQQVKELTADQKWVILTGFVVLALATINLAGALNGISTEALAITNLVFISAYAISWYQLSKHAPDLKNTLLSIGGGLLLIGAVAFCAMGLIPAENTWRLSHLEIGVYTLFSMPIWFALVVNYYNHVNYIPRASIENQMETSDSEEFAPL